MAENRYFYAVGRRKTSAAQVRLYPEGTGRIVVNEKPAEEYFTRPQDLNALFAPLQATGHEGSSDITVKVTGGGITGQSDAVKMGIARALLKYDEELRPTLRRGGFLTRDPRAKERKKPGLKRARKAPQYTKR
ncbi:MAG: 30S ribosomal protein S9 [Ardenticatenaceae bacterium]|nr:30S ribosomal protein S9 [Ardenticatenaceae bacterium]